MRDFIAAYAFGAASAAVPLGLAVYRYWARVQQYMEKERRREEKRRPGHRSRIATQPGSAPSTVSRIRFADRPKPQGKHHR